MRVDWSQPYGHRKLCSRSQRGPRHQHAGCRCGQSPSDFHSLVRTGVCLGIDNYRRCHGGEHTGDSVLWVQEGRRVQSALRRPGIDECAVGVLDPQIRLYGLELRLAVVSVDLQRGVSPRCNGRGEGHVSGVGLRQQICNSSTGEPQVCGPHRPGCCYRSIHQLVHIKVGFGSCRRGNISAGRRVLAGPLLLASDSRERDGGAEPDSG